MLWKHRLLGVLSLLFQLVSSYWSLFGIDGEDEKWDMTLYYAVTLYSAQLIWFLVLWDSRYIPNPNSLLLKLEVCAYFSHLVLIIFITVVFWAPRESIPHGLETMSMVSLAASNVIAAYSYAKVDFREQIQRKRKEE